MNEIKNHGKKWFYWFTLGVALIIIYKLLDQLTNVAEVVGAFFNVIAPILSGAFIAYLLYLPCKKLEGKFKKSKIKIVKNKARALSILTVYIIAIIFLVIVITSLVPIIVDSTTELISNSQTYIQNIIKAYQQLDENSIWKSEIISNVINTFSNIKITEFINPNNITEYAKEALQFITSIFDSFVAIVVSIYVLSERERICNFLKRGGKAILNNNTYKNLAKYFNSANVIFSEFLTTQILDAIIVSIVSMILLSIIGVKYAPLLGFIIGLFNIIPYIGAIIGVGLSAIITAITGGISQAIWMLIIIIIFQQIDANIINPKLVGSSLKISPLLVIIAVSIGGAYWGILGMFVAVPISAVIKIIAEDYIDFRTKKKKIENQKKAIN